MKTENEMWTKSAIFKYAREKERERESSAQDWVYTFILALACRKFQQFECLKCENGWKMLLQK